MNVLDYNHKIEISCVIENIVALVCFTVLAIWFNKWWIVFCSVFFMKYTVKEDKKDENRQESNK